MNDIENQLHVVHSLCRQAEFSNVERESTHDTAPIARITSVTANSPADQAVSSYFKNYYIRNARFTREAYSYKSYSQVSKE